MYKLAWVDISYYINIQPERVEEGKEKREENREFWINLDGRRGAS